MIHYLRTRHGTDCTEYICDECDYYAIQYPASMVIICFGDTRAHHTTGDPLPAEFAEWAKEHNVE